MILWTQNIDALFRRLGYLSRLRFLHPLLRLFYKRHYANTRRSIFGISFDSPFGIACGFDPDCELYDTLSNFGPGYVQIGPITLREKDGKGVEEAVARLRLQHPKVKLVANIVKSDETWAEDAVQATVRSMALLYDFVDMFVIDSKICGVTEDLDSLSDMVEQLLETRRYFDVKRPVFINITAGASRSEVDSIIAYTMKRGLDGVVVKDCSLVDYVHEKTSGNLVIIASGEGVGTPEMAYRLLCDGANLVEFDQAFLKKGPVILKQTNKLLHQLSK